MACSKLNLFMIKKTFFFLGLAAMISCNSQKENATLFFGPNIDTTVSPAQDFFSYGNGRWIKNNPIPSDESSWGIGNLVQEEIYNRMLKINKEAAQYAGTDEVEKKVGAFWKVAMDSSNIELQGLDYLRPYMDSIYLIRDLASFQRTVVMLQKIGVATLASFSVRQDDKNSSQYALYLNQGGLGLPDRDYYFRSDSITGVIRHAYADHIENILVMLGMDRDVAHKDSRAIYTFETRLAMFSKKIEDLRDPYSNYHKMSFRQLDDMNRSVRWSEFLNELGVKNVDSAIVGQPEFFISLDTSLKVTSLRTLKEYLLFHLINGYAEALPVRFGVESFAFTKYLSGAKERKPRWKRTYRQQESIMGELLGQLYVKQYFNDSSKKRYEVMAQDITDAFRERMKKLDWMSDATKQKAIAKLNAMKRKIGYPDQWKDFSAMEITSESYVKNMINGNKWWHQYEFNKLGKPIDTQEWDMFPQTYNAYYDPSKNEMVFPAAAFLVPGYKDSELDEAMMYGYSGASFFGHEITHGFDDQGRLYDAAGNLHNWWTPADSIAFSKRAELIIRQFNNYEPVPGFHINGSATQGENIADLGGIEIGIDAFKKSKAFKDNHTIGGFTSMQRFFLGYTMSWMYEFRPEQLRTQVMTDVHAPAKYRVNGPLSNVLEFYKTYNVQKTDSMFRADSIRVKIW